jgi:hypothetical protein
VDIAAKLMPLQTANSSDTHGNKSTLNAGKKISGRPFANQLIEK